MTMSDRERQNIERSIEQARDGVGVHIDELDRKIRGSLDFKSFAGDHAPQLVVGGAAVGFLVGFGFPRLLRRMVGIGVPLALMAMKVKKARNNNGDEYAEI
jgi:hypothetical protein